MPNTYTQLYIHIVFAVKIQKRPDFSHMGRSFASLHHCDCTK